MGERPPPTAAPVGCTARDARLLLALVSALLATAGLAACGRPTLSGPGAGGAAPKVAPPAPSPADLPGVVNPWGWSRAAGAGDDARAIEDIGPYEPIDRADPDSLVVNTNAHYWTKLVGLAFDRDVDIDFDDEPVDLNGDGVIDAHLTRHIHVPGGILAHPETFGLTPTPEDPRGRVGAISVSTGVLGLREALRPDGTPSGQIGMTCWICHGSRNSVDGKVVLGLAGTTFDYGLLLATSSLLDEKNQVAADDRRARGFPPGRAVRARLLMAGPGRQDLVNEFGFDVTVPGYHSAFYPAIPRARGKPAGVFNPISVPTVLATRGLRLQNWAGSEDSTAPALERLVELAEAPERAVLSAFGLPLGDKVEARRALLTDLRNLATLSLQQDSYPGLLWSDAVYGGSPLRPGTLAAIPPMYAAQSVRKALAASAASVQRPPSDPRRVERGGALFRDRIMGEIANLQILPRAPEAYAAEHLRGVVLAPIDPTQPLGAKIPVRCADCHSASPLERVLPLASNPPPLGRCTHCHLAHPPSSAMSAHQADPAPEEPLVSIQRFGLPARAEAEVATCERCHHEHRDFGPLVYSSSRLLPFDANVNGVAQGDEPADQAAGGIGTEPLIQIEVPPTQRPPSIHVPVIRYVDSDGPIRLQKIGVMWVRVPPLLAVYASAPYLHNGSVPSLLALLEPANRRPVSFAIGATGFVLDTRLPGNRNIGHEFGTRLSSSEKADLIAFLRSL
jgi:hypothetical protein